MDYESVKDYFDGFLLKKPQGKSLETIFIILIYFQSSSFISYSQSPGKIIDGKINIGNGWASDAGIYEVCSNIVRNAIVS